MDTTKKIAIACFVGGVLCSSVALVFTPDYWWLGLLAGFAGGYLGYEFREACKAIPVALRATRNGGTVAWDGAVDRVREWRSHDHPFAYTGVFLVLPLTIWFAPSFVDFVLGSGSLGIGITVAVVFLPLALVEIGYVLVLPIVFLAFIGARLGERCYWRPFISEYDQVEHAAMLSARGYCEKPLTYGNVLRWAAEGLGITALFFVWTLWKYLAIRVWQCVYFACRFLWHLFRLIHSEKRVLCGIDGTLGGMISYVWLISPSALFAEQVLLVLFGGLLGAAFGVVNWEIVSIRVLKVATKRV